MDPNQYDLVVIGSGPAGQKGAICAAKLRKTVAIIEKKRTLGGVCVNTGTIPSKTFREAVLYAELAKAQMLGDEQGLLKLLFDPSSLRLLGVHAIGERAAEIIHIGQAAMALGGTMEYFRDTIFNYPTLAEAYKVAALDGLNKL